METIGDAYMLVCNCTTRCEDHVDNVLDFAMQMQAQAKWVALLQLTCWPVCLLASGPVAFTCGKPVCPLCASPVCRKARASRAEHRTAGSEHHA